MDSLNGIYLITLSVPILLTLLTLPLPSLSTPPLAHTMHAFATMASTSWGPLSEPWE